MRREEKIQFKKTRDESRLDEIKRDNVRKKLEKKNRREEQMTYHSRNKMEALNSLKGFTVFLKHSRGNQLFTVIRHALRTIIISSRNK